MRCFDRKLTGVTKDLITKIYQIIIIVKTRGWEKKSEKFDTTWDRISKNIRTSVKTRIRLSRKHRPLETKYIVIHVSERGTRVEHGPTDSHKSHCYSRAFGVFLEILKDNNWTCSGPGRPSKQSIGLFCSGTSNWFHRNLPFHKSGDWWWKYCFQALGLLARRCVRFGWNFILEIWSLAYAPSCSRDTIADSINDTLNDLHVKISKQKNVTENPHGIRTKEYIRILCPERKGSKSEITIWNWLCRLWEMPCKRLKWLMFFHVFVKIFV